MISDYIYVHLDGVTNSVLCKGIIFKNYDEIIRKIPENILLLNASKDIGEFEPHTGFQMIHGVEKVRNYLKDNIDGNSSYAFKCIDFESMELLRQLTPVEISELLYVAHAHTHLHSPFYYKLQNNYIYLSMTDNFKKIYFRYLEQFYDFLNDSLTKSLELKCNEKKKFFQKETKIQPAPKELIRQLIPLLREGVLFSFTQIQVQQQICEIPIFLVEDRLRDLNQVFSKKDLIGTIYYDKNQSKWSFKEESLLEPLNR
ncbi:hypothetical protein SAMN04488700_0467 [Carnobacterium iners]|uniref:Uncharacterized protein n=1 Tax=Carnobacterium iners TaxID=1073423 RepID=A0A1X7MS01_9LACT|nr:hypothetical protein [Carnobacterium iners]SEL12231.1 hypothetical protein SAMN04488114_12818 [Carnobacterium iners]SMH27118.1 hypothetical protein SAMN04488700_0467 [Carnobacterium iners]